MTPQAHFSPVPGNPLSPNNHGARIADAPAGEKPRPAVPATLEIPGSGVKKKQSQTEKKSTKTKKERS